MPAVILAAMSLHAISMRRFTPAFVVTLSALSGGIACNPPRPLAGNPPQPEPSSAPSAEPADNHPVPSAEATASATATSSATASAAASGMGSTAPPPAPRTRLNPSDSQGREILLNYNNNGCFVYLPFPPPQPGRLRPPGAAPPILSVQCPPEMQNKAFENCRGGSLSQSGERCECFQAGNPPRTFVSPCPE